MAMATTKTPPLPVTAATTTASHELGPPAEEPPTSEKQRRRHRCCSSHPHLVSRVKAASAFLLSQWMIVGIGVVCGLAYRFPHVAAHGGVLRSEYSILYGAVAVIFLASGLGVSGAKLRVHAANWRLHCAVQGASFALCPVTMYALVHAVSAGDGAGRIDRAVLVGFLLTACIPTTIASNVVMTRAADGDEAAALVEVLLGNVVGPVVSPAFTVALMPKGEGFDMWKDVSRDLSEMYKNVFKLLGLSVYLPLAVGQLIRWRWPDQVVRAMQRWRLNKVGTFCLLLLIWSSFSSCFATSALQTLSTETVVLVVFLNIGVYMFWTIICFGIARMPESWTGRTKGAVRRFSKPETIAICFCGPAKTAGLGIPLVYAMWTEFPTEVKAKISIPVVLYTTEQVFCAHFLVHAFRRWVRRDGKGADEGVLAQQESDAEASTSPSATRCR